MQATRRTLFVSISFVLLMCINLAIFLKKDEFAYTPYATYAELYKCRRNNCIGEWEKVKQHVNQQDIVRAAKIAKDSAFVSASDPAELKARKIFDFLHAKFRKQAGSQSPEFSRLSTFQKYDALSNSKVTLFCSSFAEFIHVFCWSVNVPSRIIEIPGTHAVNEIYIAEKGVWQHVDLGYSLFAALSEQRVLNTVDIIQLKNSARKIQAKRANYVTEIIDPKDIAFFRYYSSNDSILFYKNTNWSENYSPINKLKRYILPTSFNVVYQEHPKSNMKYYIKVSVLILWIINALMLTYLLYNDRSKKYKESLQRQNSN